MPGWSSRPSQAELRPARRSPSKLESPAAYTTWPAAGARRSAARAGLPRLGGGGPGAAGRRGTHLRLHPRHQVVAEHRDRAVRHRSRNTPTVASRGGSSPRNRSGRSERPMPLRNTACAEIGSNRSARAPTTLPPATAETQWYAGFNVPMLNPGTIRTSPNSRSNRSRTTYHSCSATRSGSRGPVTARSERPLSEACRARSRWRRRSRRTVCREETVVEVRAPASLETTTVRQQACLRLTGFRHARRDLASSVAGLAQPASVSVLLVPRRPLLEAPPVGFEPTLPPPEGGALSPELRGLGWTEPYPPPPRGVKPVRGSSRARRYP